MSRPQRCASQGCGLEAHWLPVLVMRQISELPGSKQSRAEMDLPICHIHRLTLKISDVLTDESWDHMCEKFKEAGKIMPERDSIELDFKHIENGYYC